MSTESPDTADTGRTVAPQTVEAILADLRDAEIAVPEEPTRDTTAAAVARLDVRETLPHTDIGVSADDLGLTPAASAWDTPEYNDRAARVSLSLTADGDTDTRLSSCAELEPDAARDLALQLLAAAAIADDTTDGPEGYLTE
jgi:hypothetical protein